jgi:ATP phosphoribosyltransferase regulatory subunit
MAKTLLPTGFQDLTGAFAKKHLFILTMAANYFTKLGYELVLPSLFEYQDSRKNHNSIQMIDGLTNQVIAIRSDITDQVSRIWEQEGAEQNKKYCYYGDVFYHKKHSIHHARKLTQVGIEFISQPSIENDLEVFNRTLEVLEELAIKDYALVIAFPKLFFNYCKIRNISKLEQKKLQKYLLDKNLDALKSSGFKELLPFIIPNKNIENNLSIEGLEAEIALIKNLLNELKNLHPNLQIIIDPFDIKKYNYHSDFVFSITSHKLKKAIARGGRYNIKDNQSAVGSSFYIEELIACDI